MSNLTDKETYLARAAEAKEAAEAATLDNVRDRCLRSEAAWSAMATRAARTERMRADQLAKKAAEADAGAPLGGDKREV
ncbi:MAG TPA: hypothetical protein VM346_10030 [Sphingomicrobium sp.]|nr:hypothetical protein [Sphingomicrobium sp.]